MNGLTTSIFAILTLSCSLTMAKVSTSKTPVQKPSVLTEKALMDELSGKSPAVSANTKALNLKKAPLPIQHFMAGQKAAEEKNYIIAIKHFNTVLKKYPNSAQVKPALVAKARIYKEMGLMPQAQHNLRMAQTRTIQKKTTKSLSQSMKASEKSKIVK